MLPFIGFCCVIVGLIFLAIREAAKTRWIQVATACLAVACAIAAIVLYIADHIQYQFS